MPARTPAAIEVRIEEGRVVLKASVRQLDEVHSRYMTAKMAGWTEIERSRYYRSTTPLESTTLLLYTDNNGWACVLYALQGKNLIILSGHEYLEKISWDNKEM